MIVNKRELADIFGVSERTLTEYQKGGMPVAESGERGQANRYLTEDVHRWLLDRALRGAQNETTKERLERIKGDREELAYANDIGELVPAAEVEKTLSSLAVSIRNTILQGANKLKTELDALYGIDTDIDLLNEHNRAVLTQLSADADNIACGDIALDEENQAAAEDEHDGMGEHL